MTCQESSGVVTPFIHNPLSLEPGSIRLLKFKGRSEDGTIQCSIVDASVHDTSYTALSYECRQYENVLHEIKIDGHPFLIHDNLFQFLDVHVDQLAAGPPIWIDAICIAQTITTEKNHQVAQMGLVYSNAATVYVWLGPARDTSDDVFTFLNTLRVPDRQDLSCTDALRALSDRDWDRTQIDIYHDGFVGQKLHKAPLRSIFSRTYWTRVWVIQEILAAKRLVVCCGTKSLPWITFSLLAEALLSDRVLFKQWIEVITDTPSEPILRGWLARAEISEVEDLQVLITRYCSSECEDPRDKAYGMLSLASQRTRIKVDYSLQPVDVLIDALETFSSPVTSQQLVKLMNSFQVSYAGLMKRYLVRYPTISACSELHVDLQKAPAYLNDSIATETSNLSLGDGDNISACNDMASDYAASDMPVLRISLEPCANRYDWFVDDDDRARICECQNCDAGWQRLRSLRSPSQSKKIVHIYNRFYGVAHFFKSTSHESALHPSDYVYWGSGLDLWMYQQKRLPYAWSSPHLLRGFEDDNRTEHRPLHDSDYRLFFMLYYDHGVAESCGISKDMPGEMEFDVKRFQLMQIHRGITEHVSGLDPECTCRQHLRCLSQLPRIVDLEERWWGAFSDINPGMPSRNFTDDSDEDTSRDENEDADRMDDDSEDDAIPDIAMNVSES
jgi:hypothetical protein